MEKSSSHIILKIIRYIGIGLVSLFIFDLFLFHMNETLYQPYQTPKVLNDIFAIMFIFHITFGFFVLPVLATILILFSVVVAIKTRLKLVDTKWLLGLSVLIVLITILVFTFSYDVHDSGSILKEEFYPDYSEPFGLILWESFAKGTAAVFGLYSFVYFVYAICTKFKEKGSKTYFFISLACLLLSLCIAGVLHFISEEKTEEDGVEQMIQDLEALGRDQDTIDFIPDFDIE